MTIKDNEISKILLEIAKNEHEKYRAFREKLTKFCSSKKNGMTELYRILKAVEIDIGDCLNGSVHINVERTIIIKVLKTIRIELDILRHKMKNPNLFISESEKQLTPELPPSSKWTSDHIYLIELMYVARKYMEGGNVSIKTLQAGCEYFFQVQFGDLEERFKEIEKRENGNKAQFLEILINNLNNIENELKETTNDRKLKWTGKNVDFVELIYALHASGNTNSGKIELDDLYKEMSNFFSFDLKDFKRTFSDITNRVKGDRTRFLNELKKLMLKKLEDEDMKKPRK